MKTASLFQPILGKSGNSVLFSFTELTLGKMVQSAAPNVVGLLLLVAGKFCSRLTVGAKRSSRGSTRSRTGRRCRQGVRALNGSRESCLDACVMTRAPRE